MQKRDSFFQRPVPTWLLGAIYGAIVACAIVVFTADRPAQARSMLAVTAVPNYIGTGFNTPVTTSSDTAVQLLAADNNMLNDLSIVSGSAGGDAWISLDGGLTYPGLKCPAGGSIVLPFYQMGGAITNKGIFVKRSTGGTNVSVTAWANGGTVRTGN